MGNEKNKQKNKQKPADNKRFGAMAGVVLIHAVVFWTTVSGSPNGVQLSRHFAKPPDVRCNSQKSRRHIEEFENKLYLCKKNELV